ncbi:hypothetical protein CHU98_g10363 [Xylaria longipes]|nr:hypothetical protein CHU98_g10363 [Xylaria longipes]
MSGSHFDELTRPTQSYTPLDNVTLQSVAWCSQVHEHDESISSTDECPGPGPAHGDAGNRIDSRDPKVAWPQPINWACLSNSAKCAEAKSFSLFAGLLCYLLVDLWYSVGMQLENYYTTVAYSHNEQYFSDLQSTYSTCIEVHSLRAPTLIITTPYLLVRGARAPGDEAGLNDASRPPDCMKAGASACRTSQQKAVHMA